MDTLARNLWLIPALPLLAAGLTALARRPQRRFTATLAIGSLALACVLSVFAFIAIVGAGPAGGGGRLVHNFDWLEFGTATLRLGWLLDPLSAAMLVMVTFVGTLIFIFSTGYLAHDANYTRFFCFLSLFAAAMLGLVLANSLLLLFACWEVVGLASYLLIGFWFEKPAAAAAAKKAFLTTRIGDLGFLLGLVWLYAETGTLLCYDGGHGCLETSALARLVTGVTASGMAVSTAVALLLFCGAVGKSGQLPLHVWLPDAMEGPTPVSALIHAATMVAAGVFLMARLGPLVTALPDGADGVLSSTTSPASCVIAWVGAATALFAALIAVAQTDIKRILAYSTVSQLGLMFLGLGTGGAAVGMLHLLSHAFFKALLFLGAGSVIHGCHEEQDIRRMGGLRKFMPVTFATYAVGMMALSGVPLFFAGFWSKDAILHAALEWSPSRGPLLLGLGAVVLTGFYMTRQMWFVFFAPRAHADPTEPTAHEPHESPKVMTVPLVILAGGTILLSLVATPFWPWLEYFLAGLGDEGHSAHTATGTWFVLGLSTVACAVGLGLGGWVYVRPRITGERPDPLAVLSPKFFRLLERRFLVDELYAATVGRLVCGLAHLTDQLDRTVWSGLTELAVLIAVTGAWLGRKFDELFLNGSFDDTCAGLRDSGRGLSRLQTGHAQQLLRALAVAVVVLVLALVWIGRS